MDSCIKHVLSERRNVIILYLTYTVGFFYFELILNCWMKQFYEIGKKKVLRVCVVYWSDVNLVVCLNLRILSSSHVKAKSSGIVICDKYVIDLC